MPRLSPLPAALLALPLLGWVQLTTDDNGGPPLHWTTGHTVLYHVHSEGYSEMPLARVRGAIDRAFASWELPCSTVTSQANARGRDGDTPAQDGQSIIRFEEQRLPPEVDPDVVLAFTMHVGVYCTGMITEADITFNAVSVPWSDGNDRDRADIETVALHEIGHLLGLGHTGFDWAVMYPSIVERVRRDLSRDEDEAICAMYGDGLGDECARDTDCGGGEVCMVQGLSDEGLGLRCGPRLGAARTGQRCDAEADVCSSGCRNGLCLADGVCSTICAADRDCPEGWLCFPDQLDGGQDFGYCVNLTVCDDDVDACPAGEVCTISERPSGDALFRVCTEPAGGGDVGDACRNADACRAGLCIDGLCSQPCDADADCPQPFACLPIEFGVSGGGSDSTNLCVIDDRPCSRNADCERGLVCAFRNASGETTTECAESLGGGPAGTPCRSSRDCEASVCLGDVCTAPCTGDADCPDGWLCDRTPIFGDPTAACVPGDDPPPARDAGEEPPPERDAGEGPDPERDAGGEPPPPDPDDGRPAPVPPDAGPFDPAVADGLITTADATRPVTNGPDAGSGQPPVGAVQRNGGGGGSGCVQAPGRAPGATWLLAALPLVGVLRRRRARTA